MSLLLHPERMQGLLPEVKAFCVRCAAAMPWDVLVVSGLRTEEEQRAMYAQGRTTPGPGVSLRLPRGRTITEAPNAEETPHGRGAAVDLAPCLNGKVDWSDMKKFEALGLLAESMGLVWGGRFKKVDADHLQLRGWKSLPYPPKPQPRKEAL